MQTLLANPADAIVDSLIGRAESGMEAIGAELQQKLEEAVSVPVGRQGKVVIRSLPGEPPRTEFGDYGDSFRHVTTTEGDVVRTIAGTVHVRGPWFEEGTSRMQPRPHFGRVRDEFAANAVERVSETIFNP